ncbi:MAG: hypothetical protein IIY16_00815, partial [Oscillospiraceae bacterium]|nr:hypothetical protein [Oscillospiraceae bacterium]
MKKIYTFFLMLVLLAFTAFGVCSLFDKDDEISVQENRGLKQKPEFSFSSFFSGAYMQELEAYYTDQFPLREALMGANSTLNKFYSYSSGDEGAVIIQTTGNAGAGGIGSAQEQAEATESTQQTEAPQTQTEAPQPGTETEQTGETAEPTEETAQQPEEVSEEDPEFDNPENAETVNSMLVVGDRAMEIVYANEEMEAKYAEAVNSLDEILGPDVKTYSLITPNSTQFYGPEEMREGTTDQKAMIDNVYSQLSSNVTSVDAYSKLRSHIDEYIYFRTDHHWTQLGAYYAYTAFCEAAGLETVELDEFETGLVSNPNTGSTSFLGTFYNNVADHPVQAAAMQANPDTVTYYMPIVKTDATAYTSLLDTGELYGAWNGITTVAKTIGDSYL